MPVASASRSTVSAPSTSGAGPKLAHAASPSSPTSRDAERLPPPATLLRVSRSSPHSQAAARGLPHRPHQRTARAQRSACGRGTRPGRALAASERASFLPHGPSAKLLKCVHTLCFSMARGPNAIVGAHAVLRPAAERQAPQLPPPAAPLRVTRSAARSPKCEHAPTRPRGGRRRAAGAAGEHRRVPPSLTVVMRGGRSGERGIRTLGRLLTYVRLASGRGCPHRPVLGPSGLRASCLPQIPCSALRACARNGGGRRDSQS